MLDVETGPDGGIAMSGVLRELRGGPGAPCPYLVCQVFTAVCSPIKFCFVLDFYLSRSLVITPDFSAFGLITFSADGDESIEVIGSRVMPWFDVIWFCTVWQS